VVVELAVKMVLLEQQVQPILAVVAVEEDLVLVLVLV